MNPLFYTYRWPTRMIGAVYRVAYCPVQILWSSPRPLVTVGLLPVARCLHHSIDFSRQAGKWAESAILSDLLYLVLCLPIQPLAVSNRASARADTQMTHRKESNTESGHNTKWLITANGPLQS